MDAPKYLLKANSDNIHYVSPSWLVYFVKFSEPASMFNSNDSLKTESIIADNDCVNVTINNYKNLYSKTCNLTMKVTDINYQSKLAPGDWVVVWISNNPNDIKEISKKLKENSDFKNDLCNWQSGLKFVGRVVKISTNLSVSKNGIKTVTQNIQCQSFLEMANSVYFTYQLLVSTPEATEGKGAVLLDNAARGIFKNLNDKLDSFYKELTKDRTPDNVVLQLFIFLLGIHSMQKIKVKNTNIPGSFTDSIYLPPQISKIFNRPQATEVWQIYNFYGGVQKYDKIGFQEKETWKAFNPLIENITASSSSNKDGKKVQGKENVEQKFNVIWRTPTRTQGTIATRVPLWDNEIIWSILNQFSHSLINEMYTSLKVNPDNCIGPSLTIREKPFSTGLYNFLKNGVVDQEIPKNKKESKDKNKNKNKIQEKKQTTEVSKLPATFFGNLPRWVIDNTIINSVSVQQDEGNRVNLVSLYPNSAFFTGTNFTSEDAIKYTELERSAIIDYEDISRNGLRADINQDQFFLPLKVEDIKNGYQISLWTKKRADWLFNGHLKLYGTAVIRGIVEPISEGDNVEINGIVYHIDGITHNCSITPNGIKSFTTILQLSNGLVAEGLEDENFPPSYVSNLDSNPSSDNAQSKLLSSIFFLKE